MKTLILSALLFQPLAFADDAFLVTLESPVESPSTTQNDSVADTDTNEEPVEVPKVQSDYKRAIAEARNCRIENYEKELESDLRTRTISELKSALGEIDFDPKTVSLTKDASRKGSHYTVTIYDLKLLTKAGTPISAAISVFHEGALQKSFDTDREGNYTGSVTCVFYPMFVEGIVQNANSGMRLAQLKYSVEGASSRYIMIRAK